ncbi:MAG: hypothetical protein GYA51_14025 [Candidatus Methanofastidiosa archaeon]|jgi:hypothetical protein|nr:hypothetical protein [Candidatus Methanofastidiosa archaeon]
MRKIVVFLMVMVLSISIFISPISAAQNTLPVLEGGALLYTFKGNVFSYKFQVNYIDEDGDMPNYIFVFINGSRRIMEKQDIKDYNSKDGIIYILEFSQDELYTIAPKSREWDIEYWFRTNDGHGPVSTAKYNLFALDAESMGMTTSHSAGGGGTQSSSPTGCACGH